MKHKYQPNQLSTVLWIEQEDEYFLDPGNLYRFVFYLTASLWLFDEEVMNADDKSGYFLNVAYYDIKSYYEEKMWEVIPEGYNCRELLEKDIKRFFEYLDENPDIRDASI